MNRARRVQQLFTPRLMVPECECPADRRMIKPSLLEVLDQLRQGFVEVVCRDCGKKSLVFIGDCFTISHAQTN